MVSRIKAPSEWIWCTWPLKTYHMYLFWHDHVCRHRLRHCVGKWHHSAFFLKFVSCVRIDTKMSHLKRRWKVLRANQCYGNLPFISINVSFRKTPSLKTFPWIFPYLNFTINTITFDVSNGVNVWFVHLVLLSTSSISSFAVISGSTISPSSVAKHFWWVYSSGLLNWHWGNSMTTPMLVQ